MQNNDEAARKLQQTINERQRALDAAVEWCRIERKNILQMERTLTVLQSGQRSMFGNNEPPRPEPERDEQ